MNAMIRVLKGTLAVLALAGLGWLLHWMTAGSISGLRTYDLDSLTVLAVGTIAWIAYAWLALAVVLTVLEQVPGVVGELAGAVAGRITTKTARALLRSGLGVAAVTPLTIGAAHATPDTAHVRHTTQPAQPALPATYLPAEAASRLKLTTDTNTYRSTEPASSLEIRGTTPHQNPTDYRGTEAASSLEIGGTAPNQNATDYRGTQAASSRETDGHHTGNYRATEPASSLQIGDTTAHQNPTDYRATKAASSLEIGGTTPNPSDYRVTEPASTLPITQATHASRNTSDKQANSGRPTDSARTSDSKPAAPEQTAGRPTDTGRTSDTRFTTPEQAAGRTGDSARTSDGKPTVPEQTAGRSRVGVPDRPTDGAPTRYTELRPNLPVSVVVREGDSLWSIAARELGPTATSEAITARWHDWYAANRHVIGKNPDLILPGQVLRTPPTHTGDHLPPHPQEQ